MAERQLSILDVHKGTGISRSTLTNLVNGRTPSATTLDKLCLFFHVTPADFYVYSPYELTFTTTETYMDGEYKLFTNVLHYQDETLISTNFFINTIDDTHNVVDFSNSETLLDLFNKIDIIFHKEIKQQISAEVERMIMMNHNIEEKISGDYEIVYRMPWYESYSKHYS
ncbi:helix-turn-helix domain-containing protein [Apilactobacillus kunkeei]|uniref:helix-turn-helix domain-containing protein n=1 Tax=Apilactobacillus kunkeei TaxID=148814 RepID=UPI0039DF8FE8